MLFRLAPKYDELASLYADNKDFASKVTIAKVDATANDVPDEITGFPTVKLYPAGAKDSPVDYAGARTVEDLANFVRDSGKHQVDAYAARQQTDTTTESSSTESEAATDSSKDAEATRHEEL